MGNATVTKQYEDLLSRYQTMQTKAYKEQNVGENNDTSLKDLKLQLTSFVDAYGSADLKSKMEKSLATMDTAIDDKLNHKTQSNASWDSARADMEKLLSDLKMSSGAETDKTVWTPKDAAAPGQSSAQADTSASTPAAYSAAAAPKVPITSTTEVSSTAELKAALAKATPGTEIKLKNGIYKGPLKMDNLDGVSITGSKNAIIQSGPKGYSLGLTNCNNCTFSGFSVQGGQKTLMADNSSHNTFDSLDLSGAQMEIMHLRKNSSDNVIQNCDIHDAGLGGDTAAGNGRTQSMDGEGIYIGTAKSNGAGDASNNNQIINNRIRNTTAENIDIKEFTSGGIISGNTLDGGKMGGDIKANVLIKGSGYKAHDNTVLNKRGDGIRSMTISGADQSGKNNSIA